MTIIVKYLEVRFFYNMDKYLPLKIQIQKDNNNKMLNFLSVRSYYKK